jgi:hypothetical protein
MMTQISLRHGRVKRPKGPDPKRLSVLAVRREALFVRMEVEDRHGLAVVAAG